MDNGGGGGGKEEKKNGWTGEYFYIAILIWAELSFELGRIVLIRDFPGPSCPGPSCLWAELSVIRTGDIPNDNE